MVTIQTHVENTQNIKEYYDCTIHHSICQIKTPSGIQKMFQVEVWFSQYHISILPHKYSYCQKKKKKPCRRKALSLIRLLLFYVTLSIQRFLKQPILTQVRMLHLENLYLVILVFVVLVLELVLESQVFVALVFAVLELLI